MYTSRRSILIAALDHGSPDKGAFPEWKCATICHECIGDGRMISPAAACSHDEQAAPAEGRVDFTALVN